MDQSCRGDHLGVQPHIIRYQAQEGNVRTESLRAWVRQAEIDDGVKPGLSTEDAEKMKRLEQENRELTSQTTRYWFMSGALVLVVGMVLGLWLPRIRWQRRSRYDRF